MTHLVMFDVDGTLVDSTGFDGALFARAVRTVLDVEVDETWKSYREVTDSGILDEILRRQAFGRPLDELREAVKRLFVELVRVHVAADGSGVHEIPGASAFLAAVRALPGVRVAIATGGWAETALLKLEAAGVPIDGIAFASASDEMSKAAIMRCAARRALADVAAERVTYFGDTEWDRHASAELGYGFVAIGGRVTHEASFRDFADGAAIKWLLRDPASPGGPNTIKLGQ